MQPPAPPPKRTDTRLALLRSSGTPVLLHPCCICGADQAPYGYGVSLLKGRLGKWYCRDHRPDQQPSQPRLF